jgi:hypothetical protein
MAKVAIIAGQEEAFAQQIFDAWQAASTANPSAPVIDRAALKANLTPLLDLTEQAGTGKNIEFDLVFDTDLDSTTRLVWLAIPTPDPLIGEDWKKFKKKYIDDLGSTAKKAKKKKLTESVLFGCGR